MDFALSTACTAQSGARMQQRHSNSVRRNVGINGRSTGNVSWLSSNWSSARGGGCRASGEVSQRHGCRLMRRIEALVVAVACLLLRRAARRGAGDAPAVDACATHTDVLGLSRIVEVDTTGGPQFGHARRRRVRFPARRRGRAHLRRRSVAPLYARRPQGARRSTAPRRPSSWSGAWRLPTRPWCARWPSTATPSAAHTWSHAKLQVLDADKAKDEIELGFSGVSRALQAPIAPFFRFPYLRPSNASVDYLKSRNIGSFAIDVDSRDFETSDGATVKATVMAQLAEAAQGHPPVPRHPAVDRARHSRTSSTR